MPNRAGWLSVACIVAGAWRPAPALSQSLIPVPYPEQLGPDAARIPLRPPNGDLIPTPYPDALGPDAAHIPTRLPRHGRLQPSPYRRTIRPLPEDRVVATTTPFTMTATRALDGPASPPSDLKRPRDIADKLVACWQPPAGANDTDVEATVRLQFNRNGGVIGVPKLTYLKPGHDAPTERQALSKSVTDAIASCTPLHFTGGLGSAIAGVSFAIRFVAKRRDPSQQPL